MVEPETRTDFIGFNSTIKRENRDGCIRVLTQVQGMPVTDSKLAELRRLQEEIAKKAGFSTQEFNAMLNGRRLIKAIEMVSIMDILNVDANTLFSRGRM